MNTYIEQVMDKLTDLQQHTHFCVNNYDYYHKNNEMDVLRQMEKQLRVSQNYLTGFLNTLVKLQNSIEEASSKCDEFDALLVKCTSETVHKDEEDTDNKENM